jgi:hypothetical protein
MAKDRKAPAQLQPQAIATASTALEVVVGLEHKTFRFGGDSLHNIGPSQKELRAASGRFGCRHRPLSPNKSAGAAVSFPSASACYRFRGRWPNEPTEI